MDAVVKVGGSLAETPEILRAMCKTLGQLGEEHRLLVVPGGGEFADLVRDMDRRYSLHPVTAHRMAILGMDQYGFLLSELIPNSRRAKNLSETKEISKSHKTAILLPSRLMLEDDTLEASWDVTSDSVAAHIADKVRAQKLILITNVDGLFAFDPTTNATADLVEAVAASELLKHDLRTCVDKFLPTVLLKTNLTCYVVNGIHPDRIEKILANEPTICTQILRK